MTQGLERGVLLGERWLLEDEVGRAGRWAIFRGIDLETGETLGVVVPTGPVVGLSENPLTSDRHVVEEIRRSRGYVFYRATDPDTDEILYVTVYPDGEVRWHLGPDEDEKAARAIVAVEIYGLKATTKLIVLAWLSFRPGLAGYVSRRKPTGPAPPPREENFPSSVRRALLRAAGYRCARCCSEEDLEVDHVVPVFAGGAGVYENGQVLCSACHRGKTDADRREYGW